MCIVPVTKDIYVAGSVTKEYNFGYETIVPNEVNYMKRYIYLIILLIAFIVASDLQAASKKAKQPASTAPQTVSPKFSTVPFEINSDKLSIDYTGRDIQTLYQDMDKRKRLDKKDEF